MRKIIRLASFALLLLFISSCASQAGFLKTALDETPRLVITTVHPGEVPAGPEVVITTDGEDIRTGLFDSDGNLYYTFPNGMNFVYGDDITLGGPAELQKYQDQAVRIAKEVFERELSAYEISVASPQNFGSLRPGAIYASVETTYTLEFPDPEVANLVDRRVYIGQVITFYDSSGGYIASAPAFVSNYGGVFDSSVQSDFEADPERLLGSLERFFTSLVEDFAAEVAASE